MTNTAAAGKLAFADRLSAPCIPSVTATGADGTHILLASEDGRLFLVSATLSESHISVFDSPAEVVFTCVAVSPDGKHMAAAANGLLLGLPKKGQLDDDDDDLIASVVGMAFVAVAAAGETETALMLRDGAHIFLRVHPATGAPREDKIVLAEFAFGFPTQPIPAAEMRMGASAQSIFVNFAVGTNCLFRRASNLHISDLAHSDSDNLFQNGFGKLLDEIEAKRAENGKNVKTSRRVGEIECNTLYADISTPPRLLMGTTTQRRMGDDTNNQTSLDISYR